MGRHDVRPTPARLRRPVRIVLPVLLVLLLVGVLLDQLKIGPDLREAMAGNDSQGDCETSTTVALTVAPELQGPVTQALAPLSTRTLPDHECVRAAVQPQPPVETVQTAAIRPVDQAPDLWIPDSSLWGSRVPNWQLNPEGSFATSPIVVATSRNALEQLGWGTKLRPTWKAALSGRLPLAMPRISEDAADLSAVIALWQSLGKGDDAQRALVATVLAAGRAGVPTEAEAIRLAESGSADAPLLTISRQAVTVANRSGPILTDVRPTGGSPSLDYPVLSVQRPAGSTPSAVAATRARAVRAVMAQLFGTRSASLARAAGFEVVEPRRAPSSPSAPDGPDVNALPVVSSPSPVVGLAPQELAGLVDRITAMSAPSRFLAVFDVSTSMKASAGNGQNRIEFVATATKLAGDLLTDRAQAGLWAFSRDLQGTDDIVEIEDLAELGSGPKSHREQMYAALAATRKRTGGNGTALFTAAVAAMKEMKGQYDPRAGNAVVLFTDGANDDPGGPTLKDTLADLSQLYDPKAPVRLICIGIGTGVDMSQLRAMSNQAGGQAFLLKDDPRKVSEVLFDIINRRS